MNFDFIIVGAGTAGCVLANRLTSNSDSSVLLLEAGGTDKRVEVSMPVAYPKLQKTSRDWQYKTEPQKELYDRVLYQPRGKMIGGTGSMNGMIYIRGNKKDFNEWASLGCKGWSYDEVFPFFKRSENNGRLKGPFHNSTGLLPVNNNEFEQPLNDAFIKGALSCGFEFNDDFNGKSQLGVGYYQANILNGKRQSSARSFLYPVLSRSNLKVIRKAEVKKIEFKKGNAVAVTVHVSGKNRMFECNREIILCAGAINTPKLLMQSGIGDETQLKNSGIKVIAHLPGVGQNLQDHVQFFLGWKCLQPISLNSSLNLKNLYQYFFRKKGILASAICSAGGFFKSDPSLDRPDLQFHFIPGIAGDDINDIKSQPKYDGYMLGITLLRPESKGRILLNPGNPDGKPLIDPSFLSDRSDLKALVRGYDIGMKVMSQPEFIPFKGAMVKPAYPFNDKDSKESFIRHTLESVYHTAGTCKIGTDPMSVLDCKLRVKGINNLRIADASVFPSITSGNINTPVIMVAEKASDLILGK